jgi:signal transduction histidine kinase
MSASALAAIWIAALLPGTAVIVLVLVKRAAGARESEMRNAGPRVSGPDGNAAAPDGAARAGNGAALSSDLLLLRMSHDLRGPLGSQVTLCQLLVEGDAGPLSMKQRQYVEVIRRSGQSVLALVDDILDLAALESGRAEPEIAPADLAALVRGLAESYDPLGRERGIPIQIGLPREPLPVSIDARRIRHLLERMVEHLLAVTEHGYVEIAVEETDGNAVIRVRNTRDGLSEAARQSFDQQGELDGAGDAAAGPLPILLAARLAHRLGRPIAVRTGVDEGLGLELSVPLAATGAVATPEGGSPRRGNGTRVLLIDDDAAERLSVTARLEEAGYAVTPAASGSEGLALLRGGRFGAVVLDLVMPGLSGLEVLRAARTDERLAHLPFVVLSALYITRSERAVLGPAVASVVRKGAGTADELLRALDRALATPLEPPAIGGDRHA